MNKKYKLFIIIIITSIFFNMDKHYNINKKCLIEEINKFYNIFDRVNINEIESKIIGENNFKKKKINSIVNVGFTLDNNYVLETMLTVASIMKTQNETTKIRFHFGVTNNFTAENMIKLYDLRRKINNLTEFNFYYLKDVIKKMKKFHRKGEACPGKFELPIYLPNDIERLLIFDAGDLLVLRDLTELYNYDMGNYWVLGTLEPTIIYSFMKVYYNITKYVNIGSILLNIKKLKQNNFWNLYTNNRYLRISGAPDQTLFNIYRDNTIWYFMNS